MVAVFRTRGCKLPMTLEIKTIDTLHQDHAGIIAVYLVPHANGALLVDCGPGSALPVVLEGLRAHNVGPRDITDVLLTHIHLDHAGAAGWWSRQGATVHVHPIGAPHLLNPEKLLASAQRIYGDDLGRLWGDFLAVPTERLVQHHDNDIIEIGGHTFAAIETPGHAEHHFAYLCEGVCFTGDIGGVRLNGLRHVRPPTPPPEINFTRWRASLARLRDANITRLAPTHYGLYGDVAWHLDALERNLDALERWTASEMAHQPDANAFRAQFASFLQEFAASDGYTAAQVRPYDNAAGSDMSADGVYRYWKKYRAA